MERTHVAGDVIGRGGALTVVLNAPRASQSWVQDTGFQSFTHLTILHLSRLWPTSALITSPLKRKSRYAELTSAVWARREDGLCARAAPRLAVCPRARCIRGQETR